MSFLHSLGAKIGAFFTGIGLLFTPASVLNNLNTQINIANRHIQTLQQKLGEPKVGAVIPTVVAVFETSLASKIGASDTSMTLVSGTNKAGNSLSGYIGFVIDEGTASEEFVACTASGTTLSPCIRGIDPVDGDLEVTALKLAHRRGASVKVTNYPVLGVLARILNGDESFPNVIKYGTSTPACSANDDICKKSYIDSVATSGAADANQTTKGVVEINTKGELAAGTATGSTGATLVPATSNFNSTSSATTTGVITMPNGLISPSFISTSSQYTWSSTTTLSGPFVFSNTSSGVMLGNGTSSVTTVAPGASGNYLTSNGSTWVATSSSGIASLTYGASTTISVVQNVTTSISTTTLPSAGTNTIYHIQAAVNNIDGVSNASWSFKLGGTNIVTCSTVGVNFVLNMDVQMLSYTNVEYIRTYGTGASGTTLYCPSITNTTISLASSPQFVVQVFTPSGGGTHSYTVDYIQALKY
jgi:hypothetical protein